MNTEKLFKNFHGKSKQEIADLVNKFIEDDFFVTHPELKNKVSILITGSVASGHHDSKSDIDLTIIFPTQKLWKEYKFVLLGEFKNKYLEPLKEPLELHGKNITYFGKINADLGSWKIDWMLREFADAIIIHDPHNKVKKLKEKYGWYPKEIYQEKISWLFAEASFLLFDRYETAMERSSFYFTEIIKLKILRLILSSLIMANHKYPTYDKHSYDCIPNESRYLKSKEIVDKILSEKDTRKIFELFVELRKEVEKLLVTKKLISRKSNRYWVGFRSTYKVATEE